MEKYRIILPDSLRSMSYQNMLVFVDGDCIFCSRTARWIYRRDYLDRIKFATANLLLMNANESDKTKDVDFIVVLYKGELKIKSQALFVIISVFKPFWRLLFIFRLIPRFLRDYLYDCFARNRYKIFGYKNDCILKSGLPPDKLITSKTIGE